MDDVKYPYPDPIPPPTLEPIEPFKATPPDYGTGWKAIVLGVLLLPFDLIDQTIIGGAYGEYLKRAAYIARKNDAAIKIWKIQNHRQKKHIIWARIDRLEFELQDNNSQCASAIHSLEIDIIDGWAQYQLERDYWGDMSPETLKAEYRRVIARMPNVGVLRNSKNPEVLSLIGNLAILPPLPSSYAPGNQTKVSAELQQLRRIRDMLLRTDPERYSQTDPIRAIEDGLAKAQWARPKKGRA